MAPPQQNASSHLFPPFVQGRRTLYACTILVTIAVFLVSWAEPVTALLRLRPAHHKGNDLAGHALQKVLKDASPIFGRSDNRKESPYARWMRAYSDETRIVQMNIPGAHDAATWNYSTATQEGLAPALELRNITGLDPTWYRCQRRSFVSMLDSGIRAFDLRYAYDITKTSLVFWHGTALQSETATVEDVLYGFYAWLDEHPTEALFLSFQHEGGNDDVGSQFMLYDILTSPAANAYLSQTRGTLGTLAEVRGKITLFRRFDLNLLPAAYELSLPGLHFSPTKWTVNGADIRLEYNHSTGETAYIEDYYHPRTPQGSSAEENIQSKLNATVAHLQRAASSHLDSLYWGFASSTNTPNIPPDTPEIQALGNGTVFTPNGGVNQRLVPLLKRMKGMRLGIMMFDFFEEPEDLVPLYLDLLAPGDVLIN